MKRPLYLALGLCFSFGLGFAFSGCGETPIGDAGDAGTDGGKGGEGGSSDAGKGGAGGASDAGGDAGPGMCKENVKPSGACEKGATCFFCGPAGFKNGCECVAGAWACKESDAKCDGAGGAGGTGGGAGGAGGGGGAPGMCKENVKPTGACEKGAMCTFCGPDGFTNGCICDGGAWFCKATDGKCGGTGGAGGTGGGAGGAGGGAGGGGGTTGMCADNVMPSGACEKGASCKFCGDDGFNHACICDGGAWICKATDGKCGGTGGAGGGGAGTGGAGGGTGGAGGGSPAVGDLVKHCGDAAFPTFGKLCATADDCVKAQHQYNCCGSVVVIGVNTENAMSFEAAEADCRATYGACGCATAAPIAEDGMSADTVDGIIVECVGDLEKHCMTRRK